MNETHLSTSQRDGHKGHVRVLVVGAGAVGAVLAVKLSTVCHVGLLVRSRHVARLRAEGLTISLDGEEQSARFDDIFGDPAEVTPDFDYLLFAVKAPALRGELLKPLAERVPKGCAVSMLNGIESEAVLEQYFGSERVIAAVTRVAAERDKAERVTMLGFMSMDLAPWAETDNARLAGLKSALEQSGIQTVLSARAREMLWHKLLWNVPFNGVCALTDLCAGDALRRPRLRAEIVALMEEVVAVGTADGVGFPADAAAKTIRATEQRFERIVPSMLQDRRYQRPLEWDALQGALVRAGKRCGVPTPRTELLAALLEALDPAPPCLPNRRSKLP